MKNLDSELANLKLVKLDFVIHFTEPNSNKIQTDEVRAFEAIYALRKFATRHPGATVVKVERFYHKQKL